MSHTSTQCKFEYKTKATGTEVTFRWQFDRSAEGLLEAIRIFGAVRLVGFINQALEHDAYNELRRGAIPLGKEKQK